MNIIDRNIKRDSRKRDRCSPAFQLRAWVEIPLEIGQFSVKERKNTEIYDDFGVM